MFTGSVSHDRLYRRPFHLYVSSRTLRPSPASKPHQNPISFSLKVPSLRNVGAGGQGGGGVRGGGGGGGSDEDDSTWNSFFNYEKNPLLFSLFCYKLSKKYNTFVSINDYFGPLFPLLFSAFLSFYCSVASIAEARTDGDMSSKVRNENEEDVVYEVQGGKKIELVPDYNRDEFIVPRTILASWWRSGSEQKLKQSLGSLWLECGELFMNLMLPEGFPESVTSDYLEYSLWRGLQGVAAQISGVLATQALLYAVGLGKGAIPTAAAVNWVLKDGLGYLSKIMLSKYGRHFDVNPKGWRLFADLLENAAFGMEILTPAFPHLFVPIGAAAGAGRSAAALIQAATRSCFNAGFAAQRNFAEVIAKGEAQGMVSKSIGIVLGIALANCIQSSTPLALTSFAVVTCIHMYCNLKSYQSIQLRTLNPYRAGLVFSEYLLSGLVPSVKEVNDEEPLFPAIPLLKIKQSYREHEVLSEEAKGAAVDIECRLQLGSRLSDIVRNREDACVLFDLFRDEGYILTEHKGRFCIVLKESSSPQDMLKSLFHVSYLYWLEKNAGINSSSICDDCKPGGRLQMSLEYVQREFNHVRNDGEAAGWVTAGLIARPLANRISIGYAAASSASKG